MDQNSGFILDGVYMFADSIDHKIFSIACFLKCKSKGKLARGVYQDSIGFFSSLCQTFILSTAITPNKKNRHGDKKQQQRANPKQLISPFWKKPNRKTPCREKKDGQIKKN